MADGSGYGQQEPTDTTHEFNVLTFMMDQFLASKYFVRVVSVISVNEDNKTVSVQIATNQLDGQGNATPHGTINNIPYAAGQAGTNAFSVTPVVGDLGVMVVSDRDISAVQSSKAIANPGSYRKNAAADGIYLLSIFNKNAPTQFFKWTSAGLDFQDASGNTMQTGSSGYVYHTAGDFVVNGISLLNHVHGEVQTGTAESGPPVP
jgi:GpV Apex motif